MGHRFDPWSRRIPHATGQLSLCDTLASPCSSNYELQPLDPCALEPRIRTKKSHCDETPMHQSEL